VRATGKRASFHLRLSAGNPYKNPEVAVFKILPAYGFRGNSYNSPSLRFDAFETSLKRSIIGVKENAINSLFKGKGSESGSSKQGKQTPFRFLVFITSL
jgi:hypothetical protein